MAWVEPKFSIQDVNAAGKFLRQLRLGSPAKDRERSQAFLNAIEIVDNWRASHAYPLNTFQVNLRKVARRFENEPLIAQRIKRYSSISAKLDRQASMKLSQMQDLGGCRAIMSNVKLVKKVHDYYLHESAIKHSLATVDDYIRNPKPSGYRGIHLVYRYYSDKSKYIYNGLKIEMQLRSRLQHAWATAVETVGMFSGQALKSSLGSDEWKRFFSLMGSVVAMREKTPLVPDTPQNPNEIFDELRSIAFELQVVQRLEEYNNALHSIISGAKNSHFYLLNLDPASRFLEIKGFKLGEAALANEAYAEAEKVAKDSSDIDTVLVSVESVALLKKAYPNYFADTRLFLAVLVQALRGEQNPIRLSSFR